MKQTRYEKSAELPEYISDKYSLPYDLNYAKI